MIQRIHAGAGYDPGRRSRVTHKREGAPEKGAPSCKPDEKFDPTETSPHRRIETDTSSNPSPPSYGGEPCRNRSRPFSTS